MILPKDLLNDLVDDKAGLGGLKASLAVFFDEAIDKPRSRVRAT